MLHKVFAYFIDQRIKAALKEGDFSALKNWLVIANRSSVDLSYWCYTLIDGRTIPDYITQESKRLMVEYRKPPEKWYQRYLPPQWWKKRNWLYPAQDYAKTLHTLWSQIQDEQGGKIKPAKFSWWQRLINWCIRKNDWNFNENSPALGITWLGSRVISLLKDPGESRHQLPPHQEKDPIEQLNQSLPDNTPYIVDHLFEAQAPTNGDPKRDKNGSTSYPLPEQLQVWLKSSGLAYQIDQHQEQKFQISQQTQDSKDIDLLLHLAEDTNHQTQAQDTSIGKNFFPFPETESKFKIDGYVEFLDRSFHNCSQRYNTASWLSTFGRRLQEKHGKKVYISEKAFRTLLDGVDVTDYKYDLKYLPAGFFIKELKKLDDKTESSLWIGYDPNLRMEQLKSDNNLFRPDPAQNKQFSTKTIDHRANGQYVIFTPEAKKKVEQHKERENKLQALTVNALLPELRFIQDENLKNELASLLQQSESIMIEGPIKYSAAELYGREYAKETKETLEEKSLREREPLFKILADALLYMQDENEVAKMIRLMKSFLKITSVEHSWFSDLYKAQLDLRGQDQKLTGIRIDFIKTVKGFLYFLDFMKERNLTIPSNTQFFKRGYGQDPFGNMKYMMDCLTQVPDLNLQMSMFENIGRENLLKAKQLIQNGYVFFHSQMVPNWYSGFVDTKEIKTHYLSPDDWSKITCENPPMNSQYYRTVFLNYIAYNCTPEGVRKALVFWKERTQEDIFELNERERGESDNYAEANPKLNAKLITEWKQIREYVLTLPTKLAPLFHTDESSPIPVSVLQNEIEHSQTHKRDLIERRYAETDIASFLKSLKVDSITNSFIKTQLLSMNTCAEVFARKDAKTLKSELQGLKTYLRDNPENIPQALALLREACFRLSGGKKWLRLEQAVAILAAIQKDTLFQIKTSEGKTLITHLTVFLKALQGKKQDVITHTEPMACLGSQQAQNLANLLGLSVKSAALEQSEEITQADILYVDIFNAVMRSKWNLLQQYLGQAPIAPRQAEGVYIDEMDHVAVDVHAKTSMKIVDQSTDASPEFEAFLFKLNALVRGEFILSIQGKDEQRKYLLSELASDPWWAVHLSQENLDFWMNAAVTAMKYRLNEDYVLESKDDFALVRIVHKHTTGRVDKVSHWDAGVHQCVSAFEKTKGVAVKIQEPSTTIFEGNVRNFLQSYQSRNGCTGTMGEEQVQNLIKHLLKVERTLFFPRAKRQMPVEEQDLGSEWPSQGFVEQGLEEKTVQKQPIYSRSYHFQAQYIPENEHWDRLLQAIRRAKAQNKSMMLFFKTIAECQRFYEFLDRNEVTKIQILDDTHPGEPKAQALRPSEELLIKRAGEKGMITLSTPAGGRAIDFSGIDYGITTDKALLRVTEQALARIGRDREFGVTFQMYPISNKDLGLLRCNPVTGTKTSHSFGLVEKLSREEQMIDIKAIEARQERDDLANEFQIKLEKVLGQAGPETAREIKAKWPVFFSKVTMGANPPKLREEFDGLVSGVAASETWVPLRSTQAT